MVVVLGVSVFGGGFDADAAWRALGFGVMGVIGATVAGVVRWVTTTYSFHDETIRLRTGLLSTNETEVPFARVQALDVEQGPVQRLFGVQSVHVQTAGGGKGGEIVLGALDAREIALPARACWPGAGPSCSTEQTDAPERRLSRSMLLLAAVTSGQIGVIVPLLAGRKPDARRRVQRPGRGGAGRRRRAPGHVRRVGARPRRAAAARVAAGHRGRDRGVRGVPGAPRGREPAPAPRSAGAPGGDHRGGADPRRARRGGPAAPAVRAGRGARRGRRLREGGGRRADDLPAAAARATSRRSWPSWCPSWPTTSAASALPRRGRCGATSSRPPPPRCSPAPRSPSRPASGGRSRGAPGLGYGWLSWRAAGWRLRDGRLAVRARLLARTTVLAPAANRESHDLSQTVLQRRGRLAHVSVAFGRRTSRGSATWTSTWRGELWVRIAPHVMPSRSSSASSPRQERRTRTERSRCTRIPTSRSSSRRAAVPIDLIIAPRCADQDALLGLGLRPQVRAHGDQAVALLDLVDLDLDGVRDLLAGAPEDLLADQLGEHHLLGLVGDLLGREVERAPRGAGRRGARPARPRRCRCARRSGTPRRRRPSSAASCSALTVGRGGSRRPC